MTDLNEFRRALRAPDPNLRPLDLPTIMTAGARMRRRRRLTIGAGSGLAVLVLLIGGGQLARVSPSDPAPLAPGAPVATHRSDTTVTPDPTQVSQPAAPDPPAESADPPAESADPATEAVGDIVHTGVRVDRAEWVIYVLPLEPAPSPDVSIGLKAVRLLPTGDVRGGYLSNETEGADRARGFHAGTGAQSVDDADMPAFGYYVGAADRITGRRDGRTVTAETARWSEDRSVVIFWFDLSDVPAGSELTSLAAYDADGKKLPTGNGTVAVG